MVVERAAIAFFLTVEHGLNGCGNLAWRRVYSWHAALLSAASSRTCAQGRQTSVQR